MRNKLILATIILAVLAGCASAQAKIAFTDLPTQGDARHGQQIFTSGLNGAPACATCHRTDSITLVGPGMAGFADRAGTRVSGLSATEYAFQSIISPAKYLVSGFSNLMYDQYSEKLSPQDIGDVIAYLMQLRPN